MLTPTLDGIAMLLSLVFCGVFLSTSCAFQCSDGYYPDPSDRTKYIRCAFDEIYHEDCPTGTVFNEATKHCERPEDAEDDQDLEPEPRDDPEQDDLEPEPRDDPLSDEPQPAPAGGYKVICYFPNWAGSRKGDGKFTPPQIDPNLCTHINYAFASLDPNTKKIKADSWVDIDQGYYKKIMELKKRNPKLKVMISIGGWSDSAGNKYSQLVSNAQSRKAFNDHALSFLKQHGFDGLDVDWEYPACPQGACGSHASDKQNFITWMKELRALFDKQSPRMELTAAVAAGQYVIDNSYDVPALASVLDFINVMTYDFHGTWEGKTGQNAPFKAGGGMAASATVEYSMKYWKQKGVPGNKLVMGLPAYGRSFTLADKSKTGFGAPIKGAGRGGEFTGEAGLLGYNEICKSLNNGWKKGSDPNAGPYAYSGDQWVGYDDPATIAKKVKWARDQGYGGAMVWDIAMDDFTGSCCGVKNPILNAINFELFGKGKSGNSVSCK